MELKESKLDGSPKLIFSLEAAGGISNKKASYVAASLSSCGQDVGWVVNDPASFRIWHTGNIPDVVCEVKFHDQVTETQFLNMWYALLPIYKRSIHKGGLPLHAGLAELAGQGILLAAPGDKGKTTCCRRLPAYWQPLCDDEALVVLDQQNTYRAHPFPTWGDYLNKRKEKTWNVQYSIPLAGIFFINHSDTDTVEPLGEGKAAILITESSMQVCEKFWRKSDQKDQREFREELFNNASKIAKKIPAYRLSVSRHGRFWEKIEQVLGL